MNHYDALEMVTVYRGSAIKEMLDHAKLTLTVLDPDDPRRLKWQSFYDGCTLLLELIDESDRVDRAVQECERIRVSLELDDWTVAAQAAAMAVGVDEKAVLDACRRVYE
jgi:hypothetical protein